MSTTRSTSATWRSIRIEWLHRVAGTPDPAGEGPVIVNTFCNFLRQLKYPGDVLAKHYVAESGAEQLRGLRDAGADG